MHSLYLSCRPAFLGRPTLRTKRYLPEFSAMSDVRYCVLKLLVRCSVGAAQCGLASDVLKKSRLNWKISSTSDTLASLMQSHTRDTGIFECRN